MPLTGAAKAYLCRFYDILDTMIAGMTRAELTDSISHNFIVQMIPHHRAAIEMSESLLQYSKFTPLRRIAQGIVTAQTRSIADMEAALGRCGEVVNTGQALCQYQARFDRITRVMFARMRDACVGNDVNADFMRQMIPHHEGAIRMSQNALEHPICPELRPILEAIITSQEKGVAEMKALLACLGC